jgi:hypothetical protein
MQVQFESKPGRNSFLGKKEKKKRMKASFFFLLNLILMLVISNKDKDLNNHVNQLQKEIQSK